MNSYLEIEGIEHGDYGAEAWIARFRRQHPTDNRGSPPDALRQVGFGNALALPLGLNLLQNASRYHDLPFCSFVARAALGCLECDG